MSQVVAALQFEWEVPDIGLSEIGHLLLRGDGVARGFFAFQILQ